MTMNIENSGLELGIQKAVNEDNSNSLSAKDCDRLKYLDSLQKNVHIQLDENGKALTDAQANIVNAGHLARFLTKT